MGAGASRIAHAVCDLYVKYNSVVIIMCVRSGQCCLLYFCAHGWCKIIFVSFNPAVLIRRLDRNMHATTTTVGIDLSISPRMSRNVWSIFSWQIKDLV